MARLHGLARCLLLALLVAFPAIGWSATGERRVALVIGNGRYVHVPALANPPNDAEAIGGVLTRVGFETVTLRYDLARGDMLQALQKFSREARTASLALVFYAGHGIEIAGRNYLIPVDAKLATAEDAEFEAIPLDLVMRVVEGAKSLRLVLLDACRDNPFVAKMVTTRGTRSANRGLAQIEPPGDMLVGYAARDGQVAADGEGTHSPYTTALLSYIETPGLEIQFLFRKVRDRVLEATSNLQQPHVYGSLGGEAHYLVPPAPVTAVPEEPKATFELAFWDSIRNSGVEADFAEYLRQFPDGTFAGLARNRLAANRPPEPRPSPAPIGNVVEVPVADRRPETAPVQGAAEQAAADRVPETPLAPTPVEIELAALQESTPPAAPSITSGTVAPELRAPSGAAEPPVVVAALPGPVARPQEPPARPVPDLAGIEAMLRDVPCSLLVASTEGRRVRITGFALTDETNRVRIDRLRGLPTIGLVETAVDPLERIHCEPLAALAALVRVDPVPPARFANRASRNLEVDQSRLTAFPHWQLDLYGRDGQVRHLRRSSDGNARIGLDDELLVEAPAGASLVVLLTSRIPLPFASRPEIEPIRAYLQALEAALVGVDAEDLRAEITVVTLQLRRPVKKADPKIGASDPRIGASDKVSPVRPALVPTKEARPQRCSLLLQRAQLGERLTDDDRQFLRGSCR